MPLAPAMPQDAARIVIRGNSGSGKTTLAREVSAALGVPHVELDAIYHQRDWTPLPVEDFRRAVEARAGGEAWVACGNYSEVEDLLLDRADTVVYFDLPRRTVMRRVIVRSLLRRLRNDELWNGNRETWRNLLSRDRERNIVLWAWWNHARHRERAAAWSVTAPRPHLRVVRVSCRRDERALRDAVGRLRPIGTPVVAG